MIKNLKFEYIYHYRIRIINEFTIENPVVLRFTLSYNILFHDFNRDFNNNKYILNLGVEPPDIYRF